MKFNRTTCRHKPFEENDCSVIIRVTYKGKRVDLYTGTSCDKSRWDAKKQRVKHGSKVGGYDYNVINSKLQTFEAFIDEYFNDCAYRSTPPSLVDLKERFNYKFKRSSGEMSDEFFFLFEKFIKEQKEQRAWNKSMKEAFVRLMILVKAYKPNITFADLTIGTMDGLKLHLSQTMLNEALVKRLSYFKQFISWASKKGYKVHEEYFSYSPKLPKSKIAIKYLEVEELKRILELKFDEFSTMDVVRDSFVFQCFTALRYSDLRTLKHDDVVETSEGYDIDKLTEKDDDRVRYSLSKIAEGIYKKYKQHKYAGGLVFPLMSNQKYNKHLKELGKLAKLEGEWIGYQYRLNEKIVVKTPKSDLCSHTARRTFITLAIQSGASEALVSQITSHSEVEAMKPYIAVTKKGVRKVISALDSQFQIKTSEV
jgi:integrase